MTGGDAAKAIACGADAVMLGEPLAIAAEAPGAGWYWDPTVSHPKLPRSWLHRSRDQLDAYGEGDQPPALSEVLLGPTADASGSRNVFGALRRAMAKCGYSSLKEFQKVELTVTG
jgi:IMP dehydrogenase